MPILPGLLEQLTRFQRNSHSAAVRDLCTELSLTVPVRLIAMLPYLRQLMYPLVSALSSHNNVELVATGIKLIDLCVENFTAEFLEPVFAEVKTQILSTLWRHLKPVRINFIFNFLLIFFLFFYFFIFIFIFSSFFRCHNHKHWEFPY